MSFDRLITPFKNGNFEKCQLPNKQDIIPFATYFVNISDARLYNMDAGLRISLSNEKLINIGEALELSLLKNEQEENSILKNSASDLIRKFFHIAEVSSLDIIYYEQPCLKQD